MNSSLFNFRIFIMCCTAIICLSGCVSPVYDTLQPIPEYKPGKQQFDTSAVIQLIQTTDPRVVTALQTELARKEYSNTISEGHFMGKIPETIHILTPLSLSFTEYNCQEGTYLETRLIVSVRQPGFVWGGKLHEKNSRYFQAFSRCFIGQRLILDTDYDEEIKTVVSNLFTIDEFRSALNPLPQNSKYASSDKEQTYWERIMTAIKNDDRLNIIRWSFISSENGDKRADALLAAHALDSGNICGDNKRLAKILTRLAESGEAVAQKQLAELYIQEKGVLYNPQKAFYWYHKAAQQGDFAAQYHLGEYCEKGIGTEKNIQMAMFWYQKSANQGFTPAATRLKQIKAAQQQQQEQQQQ